MANVPLPVDGTYKIRINAPAGHTTATANYIVTAWDVTPLIRTLNLDQQPAGNIATPYALDQWNFSAMAGQQIQFDLLARSSTGLAFKLTGPGGTVVSGFQDITADYGPINLPSSGAYTLSAYGLAGATGTYSFVMKQISVTAAGAAAPVKLPITGGQDAPVGLLLAALGLLLAGALLTLRPRHRA